MYEILIVDDKFLFLLILYVWDCVYDNFFFFGRGNVSIKVGFCCVN